MTTPRCDVLDGTTLASPAGAICVCGLEACNGIRISQVIWTRADLAEYIETCTRWYRQMLAGKDPERCGHGVHLSRRCDACNEAEACDSEAVLRGPLDAEAIYAKLYTPERSAAAGVPHLVYGRASARPEPERKAQDIYAALYASEQARPAGFRSISFEELRARLYPRPPAERKARRLGALALLTFIPGALPLAVAGYVAFRLYRWAKEARR